MFMLSTQNVACDKGISRAEVICFINRKPITAPMGPNRVMLIALHGEMSTAAAYAACEEKL